MRSRSLDLVVWYTLVWYTPGMTSKTSAVRSIRLQNGLWERLAAEAKRRDVAVNGLVADLLEVALLRIAELAVAPPAKAQASPVVRAERIRKPPAREPEPFQSRLKGEWKPK